MSPGKVPYVLGVMGYLDQTAKARDGVTVKPVRRSTIV